MVDLCLFVMLIFDGGFSFSRGTSGMWCYEAHGKLAYSLALNIAVLTRHGRRQSSAFANGEFFSSSYRDIGGKRDCWNSLSRKAKHNKRVFKNVIW